MSLPYNIVVHKIRTQPCVKPGVIFLAPGFFCLRRRFLSIVLSDTAVVSVIHTLLSVVGYADDLRIVRRSLYFDCSTLCQSQFFCLAHIFTSYSFFISSSRIFAKSLSVQSFEFFGSLDNLLGIFASNPGTLCTFKFTAVSSIAISREDQV